MRESLGRWKSNFKRKLTRKRVGLEEIGDLENGSGESSMSGCSLEELGKFGAKKYCKSKFTENSQGDW